MKHGHFSVKRLSLLAIFTALCFVGRILFQFIPNVQPMTAVLLIITLNFGTVNGLLVTIGSVFLSNIYLGMGPWTLFQIITYTIIIGITGLLRPVYKRQNILSKVFFVLFAAFAGFIYGFIISVFNVQLFGMSNFWVYYAQGLPYDFMHALGNAGFFLALEPIIGPLLRKRYKNFLNH